MENDKNLLLRIEVEDFHYYTHVDKRGPRPMPFYLWPRVRVQPLIKMWGERRGFTVRWGWWYLRVFGRLREYQPIYKPLER